MKTKRQKIFEISFVLIMFGFFFLWAYVQPFDVSPDEHMRYQIPEFIYKYGKLPHGGDPRIRNSIWGISYAFTPIFSYMIGACFMKITSLFTTDSFYLLMAARMVSILFGTGTVIITIQIAKKLFKDMYQYVYIMFVALLPQAIFICSYVNNDAMAIFSTALIIYMWILGLENNWNYRTCFGLGVGIALCSLSYYNAYGYILCSMLIFTVTKLFCSDKRFDWKDLIKKGSFITLIALILAGWWFARSYIIYDGDFIGMRTSNHYANLYAQDQFKPSKHITCYKSGKSIVSMLKDGWLSDSSNSFIGFFGYMSVPISGWFYRLYKVIFIMGFLGVLMKSKSVFALVKDKKIQKMAVFHITMVLAGIITFVLSVCYSYYSDYQPQGRYLLPMLLPFMYFVTMGIQNIVNTLFKNERIKRYILVGICFIIILIAMCSYFFYFLPEYR